MSKSRKCSSALLNSWLESAPLQKPYFKIQSGKLFCSPCGKLYEFTKISEFNQHTKTAVHCKNVSLQDQLRKRQTTLTESRSSEFALELCEAFLAADIPFTKLQVPKLKSFLEKYCGKVVPSVSSLRQNYVDRIFDAVIARIRSELDQKMIYLEIDETTDPCGRFLAKVIVGELKTDSASKPHLIMVRQLESTNNATITQLVLDALSFLWPNATQATISKQFCVLLTDGVPYMLKAGKNLKNVYPNLLHVTCLAHGLNRVAEAVRSTFKDVDLLVASVKAIFKKAPSRIRVYKNMHPDLPLPPDPVIVRWGTWLRSVKFIGDNFNALKEIINSLEFSEAACIEKAQILMEREDIVGGLMEIIANYACIGLAIERLENRTLSLISSIEIINELDETLNSSRGINKTAICRKFENVLSKNPDFAKIRDVARHIQGENVAIDLQMSIDQLVNLKYCPLTSVEVERSFSMTRNLLSDKRHSFSPENLEKYLVCHYEEAVNI